MGTLERVMQLKQTGRTDPEIIEALRQEGVPPREIEESLSQSRVKSALSQESYNEMQPSQLPQESQDFQQMQPSMMQTQGPPMPQQFTPSIGTTGSVQQIPSSYQPTTSNYQETEPYQEYYPEYSPGSDIETVNEIADQVVEEKMAHLKKQVESFSKFKDEIILNIERINERLSKTEDMLNELQIAIIKKIGEYGTDIKDIAKEMHATQDSFSKILNPLTDNIRKVQRGTDSDRPRPKTRKKGKSEKINFEDYLR